MNEFLTWWDTIQSSKERYSVICHNMIEPGDCCAKWNTSVIEITIFHNLTHTYIMV